MSVNRLIGVWKLVSGEFHHADNTITYPWGQKPEGQIIYTENGHMAAQIMDPSRLPFVARDHMKGTDPEIRVAFEGYQAYYGMYVIEEENIISHQIKGSLFPNIIGRTLKRYYELSANRLVLQTPPMKMGGIQVTGIFTWQRS